MLQHDKKIKKNNTSFYIKKQRKSITLLVLAAILICCTCSVTPAFATAPYHTVSVLSSAPQPSKNHMLPYAMSLHDTYAEEEEDEDDLPDNQLSKTLELPTIEIQPHIKHDIYSATYYITPLISEITTSNQ